MFPFFAWRLVAYHKPHKTTIEQKTNNRCDKRLCSIMFGLTLIGLSQRAQLHGKRSIFCDCGEPTKAWRCWPRRLAMQALMAVLLSFINSFTAHASSDGYSLSLSALRMLSAIAMANAKIRLLAASSSPPALQLRHLHQIYCRSD